MASIFQQQAVNLNRIISRINLGIITSVYKFFFVFLISFNVFAEQAKVAIIIDDIGYRPSDQAALNLPGKVTYSVLPHTPFGQQLAAKAHSSQRDVMLHIPMEAMNGKFMGPGGLSATMSKNELRQSLSNALVDIPQAIGINNHMGSKLTTLSLPMQWTMQFLKEQKLFFLDSKTNQRSIAEKMARREGLPTLSRHIFLDNKLNDLYIEGQFNKLIKLAKRTKYAIAIAHPHPESVAALTRLIPTLKKHNIELVSVSALLKSTNKTTTSQQAE